MKSAIAVLLNDVNYARVTLKVDGEKVSGTLNEPALEERSRATRRRRSRS